MAAETKLRKYIHVHKASKLIQMKEHALQLNMQMSTHIWDMLILSFDSLLTWPVGLVSVLFLVTAPFRKQNNFSARTDHMHLDYWL